MENWHKTRPLIPSLVYVEDASQGKVVIVGQAVRDRALDLSQLIRRFFRNFKRGIGSPMCRDFCQNWMDAADSI